MLWAASTVQCIWAMHCGCSHRSQLALHAQIAGRCPTPAPPYSRALKSVHAAMLTHPPATLLVQPMLLQGCAAEPVSHVHDYHNCCTYERTLHHQPASAISNSSNHCIADSRINYMVLYYCHARLGGYALAAASLLGALLWLLLLFRVLGSTADTFFSPILGQLSQELGLPPRLAGGALQHCTPSP